LSFPLLQNILLSHIFFLFFLVYHISCSLKIDFRGRCKHSIDEIQAAVDGSISQEQAVKLREILAHMEELNAHKRRIENEITCIAEPYLKLLGLIRTVPGFSADPMTAITVISEIGVDMSVFETAKHLCSWAGCCPRNDQSGGKLKSTRICKAGTYLKPLLVTVANAVVKSDKHPEIKERYRRIKARRGHNKAIIAICRMFLVAIWNILTKLEPYTASGYLVKSPNTNRSQPVIITQTQAINMLRARGYIIKDDTPPTAPT
jgi:hypothetical protein